MNKTQSNIVYFCIYVFSLILSIPKYGLLARYPWQDLIYADFQIYNRWRWFSESVHTSGIVASLTSTTDFRMNTGENLYLSSRVPAPIFDLGSWIYLVTQSIDIALISKYTVFTALTASGFVNLLERNSVLSTRIQYTKHLVFAILIGSFMNHPIMMHEVGPMVLWYLFLTPSWLYTFIKITETGLINNLKTWHFYVLLILTIGSSDLFILFYFPIFLIILILGPRPNKTITLQVIFGIFFVETILVLTKLNYLIYMMNESHVNSTSTLDGPWYLKDFALPLFLSVLFPLFWGPVIIFINIFIIIVYFYYGLKNIAILKKFVFVFIGLLFIQLAFGLILHTIPILREFLPSAFRYHVAPWSIFVLTFLPLFIHEAIKSDKFQRSTLSKRKVGALIILSVITLANTELLYSELVFASSKRIISREIRQWATIDMPKCIVNEIDNLSLGINNKQYTFITSDLESGRNDNLTLLIENPEKLKGRTFNQWRYSTTTSNYLMDEEFGLRGLKSWAFTQSNLRDAVAFSEILGVKYLISTVRFSQEAKIEYIGKCQVPKKLKNRFVPFKQLITREPAGNSSLQSDIFIYLIKQKNNKVQTVSISSSQISFKIACDSNLSYKLPINFSRNLRVLNNPDAMLAAENRNNLTILTLKECKDQEIKIGTQSLVIMIDILLFLILVFFIFLTIILSHFNRDLKQNALMRSSEEF